jgi:hypothetical protein
VILPLVGVVKLTSLAKTRILPWRFAFDLDATMGVITVVSTAAGRTEMTKKNARVNAFVKCHVNERMRLEKG